MNSIDHIDAEDAYADRASLDRECCHASCAFAWEVVLPGYSNDSGCTGPVEVTLTGVVLPDGEVDDLVATDDDGVEREIPSTCYERACRALVEAAACMGFATR